MTPRSTTLGVVFVALFNNHCTVKPVGCDDAACATAGATGSSEGTDDGDDGDGTTEGNDGGDDGGDVITTAPPETGNDDDPTADTTGSDDPGDGSGESTTAMTTGEPEDDMYGPCTTGDECTGGHCVAGFCTTLCWDVQNGEVPCPDAPGGAAGVTVLCRKASYPGCETSVDSPMYCFLLCDGGSTCPNASSCVADECNSDTYCGY